MKMPKMKPCPFCGGKKIDPEGCVTEYDDKDGLQATCGGCHATGPAMPDAMSAAVAWNARAKTTPEEGTCKQTGP